jgi:lipid II:glycine glycyltransferase (peptidoglycan interpeptide bridge formation enzyme)
MEKGKIVALLPAAVIERNALKVLSSHGGASYGGFVTKENISVQTAFDLVGGLLEYAAGKGFRSIEMTLPPVIYLKRLNNYLDFALYRNGFSFRKREISSVIPLDFPMGKILSQFKPEARTAYRKSVKSGVTVRITHAYKAFYKILEKNLALRHQVKPTHTLEELERLQRIFPGRIHLFGAFYKGKMVAGVTNFLCNDRVVLAFYISHDMDYQSVRPVNALFYEVIRWSIEKGFRFLDYGIFTVDEEPNWGLGKFKESFGARGIFREYYVKNLD